MGPIGSAVLTFIGYKQTDRQTDRQTDKQTDKPNLYIEGGKELELYIYMYEMERNWSCIYIRWKGIGVVYIGWKETGVVYI